VPESGAALTVTYRTGGGVAGNVSANSVTTIADAAALRDIGAKHLMLTHLIPPLGAERQGPFGVPGGPLTKAAYRQAAEDGGFTGHIVVGTDLASIRLPESRNVSPQNRTVPVID